MSATMAVTPVLADTFTDGSQTRSFPKMQEKRLRQLQYPMHESDGDDASQNIPLRSKITAKIQDVPDFPAKMRQAGFPMTAF